jgi:hypothetical protein
MSRRSAADRARREGTSAAIPIVDPTAAGGFAANDTRRIYATGAGAADSSVLHHQSPSQHAAAAAASASASSTFAASASSPIPGPGGAATAAAPPARYLANAQTRHIRADEFRVAFFAPATFRAVHAALDFDPTELVQSALFDEKRHPWRVAHSPGKSDSLFFYFGHFVIKSLKEQEFKFLYERFLPTYAQHVEMNKFTLLPRFLCLMSVADLSRGSTPQLQRFVVMNNVFPTRRCIERMYDLKGSTVNRDGLVGDITRTTFGAVLLKDNDLPPKLLLVGPVRGRLLKMQLRCDTDFLHSLSIIDYSLLVGVRSDTVKVGAHGVIPTDAVDGSCFRSWDGGMPSLPIFDGNDLTTARIDTFYIGLIDVLQHFSPAKRFEATTKGFLYAGGASVVPPDEFARRICERIERIVE